MSILTRNPSAKLSELKVPEFLREALVKLFLNKNVSAFPLLGRRQGGRLNFLDLDRCEPRQENKLRQWLPKRAYND